MTFFIVQHRILALSSYECYVYFLLQCGLPTLARSRFHPFSTLSSRLADELRPYTMYSTRKVTNCFSCVRIMVYVRLHVLEPHSKYPYFPYGHFSDFTAW